MPISAQIRLLIISLALCLISIGKLEAKQPEQLARVAVDLYVMSDCPYCKKAEAIMRQVLAELGDKLEFGLYFVSREDEANHSLGSAHLDKEAQIQLLILQHFPDKFWAYLDCRNQDIYDMPWQGCATKAGVNTQPIEQGLASGQGEKLLRLNLTQAQRLRISITPTLFINHKSYSGEIEYLALMKYICQQFPLPKKVLTCKELPECLSDEDCYQPGMIGSCESAGTHIVGASQTRCSYQPAVVVPLTIVRDKGAISPQSEVLNWLMRLFPGIKTEYVAADSPPGKQFIQDYQLKRLPAYLFAPTLFKAKNIDQLKPQLKFVKDRLLLAPSVTQAQLYINRSLKPGRIEFLFSPLSPQSNKVLLDIYRILEQEQASVNFRLRYLVQRNTAGNLSAPQGQAELEETRRQLVITRNHPEKFRAYIELRSQGLASSYWEEALLGLGLDPYQIKQQAKGKATEELLIKEALALDGLELSPAPLFLVNNRELIELQNRQQFRELLSQLKDSVKR